MFVAGPRDAFAAATNLLTLCVIFFRGPLYLPTELGLVYIECWMLRLRVSTFKYYYN